jgi:hypothetical protein
MADDDHDDGYLDGRYEKLEEKDIVHEGYLRIRASKGLPGLRPWLNRCVGEGGGQARAGGVWRRAGGASAPAAHAAGERAPLAAQCSGVPVAAAAARAPAPPRRR